MYDVNGIRAIYSPLWDSFQDLFQDSPGIRLCPLFAAVHRAGPQSCGRQAAAAPVSLGCRADGRC